MFEDTTKNQVAKWVAGDIATSRKPGRALKNWRKKFGINQTKLAETLGISPSVISDYESGRRKSPGVAKIRRITKAFLNTDERRGGEVTRAFASRFNARLPPEVVLGMHEFDEPLPGTKICEAVEGEVVANEGLLSQKLFGYTVIDGPKAIVELSASDYVGLYGLSSERALIFTKVRTGRSPLVAIKVFGVTPGAVVLHGEIKESDELGVVLAKDLRVPLILSKSPNVEKLLKGLRDIAL